ncbi:BRO-N domain-containing protein [Streptomyces sp. NPDC005122]
MLGYRSANDATRLLDEDEKGAHSVRTLGGEQVVTIVNEPGLYSLILRSKLPQAKAF